jgi:hypothetical protein
MSLRYNTGWTRRLGGYTQERSAYELASRSRAEKQHCCWCRRQPKKATFRLAAHANSPETTQWRRRGNMACAVLYKTRARPGRVLFEVALAPARCNKRGHTHRYSKQINTTHITHWIHCKERKCSYKIVQGSSSLPTGFLGILVFATCFWWVTGNVQNFCVSKVSSLGLFRI